MLTYIWARRIYFAPGLSVHIGVVTAMGKKSPHSQMTQIITTITNYHHNHHILCIQTPPWWSDGQHLQTTCSVTAYKQKFGTKANEDFPLTKTI